MRSIGAAQRRAERAAVRRQRELAQRQKQHAKMVEREAAEYEVAVYQNRIEVLRSVHKDCGDPLDWREVRDAPEPIAPNAARDRERAAEKSLAAYQPGLFDKLFKRTEARRAALTAAVRQARDADAAAHAEALRRHEEQHEEWLESRALAEQVLAGDAKSWLEVIEQTNPFGEIGSLGSFVEFRIEESGPLEVALHVHAEEVIPSEVKALTQSGKLSAKKMPQGQFYELYQDYVCGSALRVAREVFALVPAQTVIVTAIGNVLDTATGHVKELPVLSAAIPKATLERLNFETLDPSDSLRNFVHRMSFKKNKGFAPVERIRPGELQLPA